jgi:hypothetical protein
VTFGPTGVLVAIRAAVARVRPDRLAQPGDLGVFRTSVVAPRVPDRTTGVEPLRSQRRGEVSARLRRSRVEPFRQPDPAQRLDRAGKVGE